MYHLIRTQIIPVSLDQAWEFLENPRNLNRITPKDLHFEIISDLPHTMYAGQLIEYRIRIPWIGRRIWVSEIKHLEKNRSFVDEQRVGPYPFWYHYHEITEVSGGVQFLDHVMYRVPFGPLGQLIHPFYIRPTLNRIFDVRQERLQHILTAETR